MGGVKESVAFKFTKKQISVGRSHTRAHSRAVFVKAVFGIKCEVIHGKDYSNEVANGFRRDMFISAFWRKKRQASIPSLCGMLVYSYMTSSETSNKALSLFLKMPPSI